MNQSHTISAATEEDIPALLQLVNSAYRGDSSRAGWTTEADLLDGIRTNEASLREMIRKPYATILLCKDLAGTLAGCVYLEQMGKSLYLGMLTVSPLLQAQGIGKQLLRAAEDTARSKQCTSIQMTVISIRSELIAWYERHGYAKTGQTQPFPTDEKFGIPKQKLEFIVMRKRI
ncbi:MAG: GNAT family N-acetyltransferase [Williamsia sp.]|nr:GNAT family N-acetyltransferase [Williamsia sp.]